MGHRISYDEPGHAHELTFSTYKNVQYFRIDKNCRLFLQYLGQARERQKFELWAYVLMPQHVHLLVWPGTEGAKVAEILKSIKQPFSRQMIKLARCNQPRVWQKGGGYDRNLFTTKATQASIDYIHMNPVKAGLCSSPSDYLWSSAKWYQDRESGLIKPDYAKV
ncbi:MAG: transposase [Armatimonadetes bacterium]|nr:transposase [Armatimonadota bacterium]